MSFRKAIDNKCRSCIYDHLASGTWRQQVTLCTVTACPLWPHRPQTTSNIPDSVLRYYGINPGDSEHQDATAASSAADSSLPRDAAKFGDSQTRESKMKEGGR